MAMGVFLMLSADHVIGSRGEFRISANEVALGLTPLWENALGADWQKRIAKSKLVQLYQRM